MATKVAVDKDALVELVADVLDIDADMVTDDAHFVEDLGVDSLLALELAVTMEREYGIKIESHEVADIVRLREVVALLETKLTPGE